MSLKEEGSRDGAPDSRVTCTRFVLSCPWLYLPLWSPLHIRWSTGTATR